MVDRPNPSSQPFRDNGFATTHWSVVMAAGEEIDDELRHLIGAIRG